jgi:integrase
VLNHAKGLGWVTDNPTLGIRKHPEAPRRRVFSDAELAALREHATERMRAMIDISLLTALRQGDLLRLRLSDLTDEGIVVEQQKTGSRLLYVWTPALQEAVGRAKRLRKRVSSIWLWSDDGGAPIKARSLQSAWDRLRKKAGVADAHWHDLRATSLTWAKEASGIDYAQRLAGHASSRMTEAYVGQRATTKVRPIR